MVKRKSKKITFAPITSEDQFTRTKKAQNALNKQRSKSMETRIAKLLGGRRIPLSGAAAAFKGDVEIRFNNNPRGFIIECKLSAQKDNDFEPRIRIQYDWFTKLAEEAKNMNMVFGIFIHHFMDFATDYVWIRHDIVDKLINQYHVRFSFELGQLKQCTPVDIRYGWKGGDIQKTSILVRKDKLEQLMIRINGIDGVNLILPDATYLLIRLVDFREIIKDL